MSNIKIGLLFLYLELYDRVTPHIRPKVEDFANKIIKEFEKQFENNGEIENNSKNRSVEVVSFPICRLSNEFEKAIKFFEENSVDAIVTLHLAYSPSLESAPILAKTRIPIITLDTTPFYEFASSSDSDAIMLNHGIHGVQDFCNLLIRLNKKFLIEAGHWQKSKLIEKVISDIKAARMYNKITNTNVGSIGGYFEGMGDFAVEYEKLRQKIGLNIKLASPLELKEFLPDINAGINSSEVEAKRQLLIEKYDIAKISEKALLNSILSGIALEYWVKQNNLDAFTLNFTKFNRKTGLPTIPFLETELLLAKGLGYAGEGDVLTASFVGALSSVFKEVTFTEMFCPDWKENIIFLSHMGEVNIDLFSKKALIVEKNLPFIDIEPPAIAIGRLKKGKAVLANLAPQNNESTSYNLIICQGEMLDIDDEKNFGDSIRGWFKPDSNLDIFLKSYSLCGGTHHSALVYGESEISEIISKFAHLMGWNTVCL